MAGRFSQAVAASIGNLIPFRARGSTLIAKLLNEFIDRGVNVRQFGAVCNANYKHPGTGEWYEDSTYTIPAADDTDAIQAAIDFVFKGGRILLPGSSMISRQLAISKCVEIFGNFGREKSTNQVFGSRLVIAKDVDQTKLESAILINATSVKIRGVALKGKGYSQGSVGILCKNSNGSKLEVYVEGFGGGIKMGEGSAHVSAHQSTMTGNLDGVVFGKGNLFDFYFEDCLMDGNVRSAGFLEANASVENITWMRCHMGWPTQYGFYQDPATTTGDGVSRMRFIDTPIEQVAIQHICVVNGGGFSIEGGYWTWSSLGSTGTEAILITNVNSGRIEFDAKLEPSYTNPNARWLLRVAGYTNYKLSFWGSKNGFFSENWCNFNTPSVPPNRVLVNGMPYGDQGAGVTKFYLDGSNQNVISAPIYGAGNFSANAYLRVEKACTVRLWVTYHNGVNPSVPTDGDVSLDFQVTALLQPGEYYFASKYFYAYPTRGITIKANADTVNAAWVSASIEPRSM